MSRIILFHGNVEEAGQRMRLLCRSGHEAAIHEGQGMAGMRIHSGNPPDLFMIDLDRVPSRGSAIAVWLRQQRAFRHVPILFVGGEQEKVEQTRKLVPDAADKEARH